MSFLQEYLLLFRKQRESFLFRQPPQEWRSGPRGDVILLPGVLENWVFLRTIANDLNTLGFKIHTVTSLGRSLAPLHHEVQKVQSYIDQENLRNVVLLSHSKGGLIAKLLVDHPEYSERITHSFSIAVPYGGTFGKLFKHQTVFRETHQNTKITNLYPKIDHHVIPNNNLVLPGAKNIQIDIIGHTRILESPAAISIIRDTIETL